MILKLKTAKLKEKLNEAYKPFFINYTDYYEIYYGGAGSGKSHFIARKLILKALRSKRRVLIIRKVYSSIFESVYTLLKEILSKWKIAQYCKITVSPINIILPNGSEFIFKGMDDEEKLKSLENISDIWIEEATELIENDFDQLGLRMRGTGEHQQIFVSFNPISNTNWVYKRFFTKNIEALKVKTTYLDNKFLPDSYVKKINELKETNPRYYQIYGLGDWGTVEGLIYKNYEIVTGLKERVKNIDTHIVGADWGYNDPTVFIWMAVKDKVIYVYDEYYQTQKTRDDSIKALGRLKHQGYMIYADSSEPATIQEFRVAGYNIQAAIKGPNSISDGISMLQGYKILIDSSCVNTAREIQNYSYVKVKGTNDYSDIPINYEDHCMDCLRYAIFSSMPRMNSGIDWSKKR